MTRESEWGLGAGSVLAMVGLMCQQKGERVLAVVLEGTGVVAEQVLSLIRQRDMC